MMFKPWMANNGQGYAHIARFEDEGGDGDGGAGGGAAGGGGEVYDPKNYLSDASVLDNPLFEGAKSVDDLARIAIEQNAKVGVGAVTLPGDDATEDDWNKFYKSIGRPEDVGEYGFKFDAEAEDNPFDEPVIEGLKGAFHRAGLSKKQGEAAFKEITALRGEQLKAESEMINAMHEETSSMLKTQYGAALPEKMMRMKEAVRFVAGDQADEIESMLENPLYGSNKVVMGFLMRLGDKMGEATLKGGGGPLNPGAMTPAQAREEANKIIADRESPYWDATHPQHEAIRDKVQNLFRVARPPEAE